jgi:hypothetical protein
MDLHCSTTKEDVPAARTAQDILQIIVVILSGSSLFLSSVVVLFWDMS